MSKILIQCMCKIYFKMAPMSRSKLFTEILLSSLPDLCSNVVNRKTVILFNDKISGLVTEYTETPDDFFASLRKVVAPIRKEILSTRNEFEGHFNSSRQFNSVPKSLLLLINALINGSDTSGGEFSQEVLTVPQLIVSNTQKTRHNIPDAFRRKYHSQSRVTPLTLYTSLKTYSVARSTHWSSF